MQTDAFMYSAADLTAIHKSNFEDFFKRIVFFRNHDISRKVFVPEGDSVICVRWQELRMTLEYDLEKEKQFVYSCLEKGQMEEHVTRFVSGLWQLHPFHEGSISSTLSSTILKEYHSNKT